MLPTVASSALANVDEPRWRQWTCAPAIDPAISFKNSSHFTGNTHQLIHKLIHKLVKNRTVIPAA